jgi:ABC-type nitrate/sulfonate/bicarbonate transport system ATPase subunit
MIHLDQVSKYYGNDVILHNFSMKVQSGERIGLLGNSGTGKTTLLNIIAGLTKPEAGKVRISSNKIGYIFQELRLMPWKKVADNVIIGARAIGMSKQEALGKCRCILKQLEIQKYENYFPSELSGGIAQRVSIARAFLVEPEILLMDEPFSSLDPGLRNRLHDYVLDFVNERKATLLYVSHFPEDVQKITNQIFVLEKERQLKVVSFREKEHGNEVNA